MPTFRSIVGLYKYDPLELDLEFEMDVSEVLSCVQVNIAKHYSHERAVLTETVGRHDARARRQ